MNVQQLQDWALLIVPSTAFVTILVYIGIGIWVTHRDHKNANN